MHIFLQEVSGTVVSGFDIFSGCIMACCFTILGNTTETLMKGFLKCSPTGFGIYLENLYCIVFLFDITTWIGFKISSNNFMIINNWIWNEDLREKSMLKTRIPTQCYPMDLNKKVAYATIWYYPFVDQAIREKFWIQALLCWFLDSTDWIMLHPMSLLAMSSAVGRETSDKASGWFVNAVIKVFPFCEVKLTITLQDLIWLVILRYYLPSTFPAFHPLTRKTNGME